ncbi:MAG: gliding motility lipoprotein GldH [Bacteroidetes bacterium]|nr:gliding motility lipoprotein GldH [Bacteroidota bacterium]
MKINTKILYIIILFFFLMLVSFLLYNKFTRRPYYKSKLIFPNKYWDQNLKFKRKFLLNNNKVYNIFLKIKYNEQYPYYNIFLKCNIKDKEDNLIKNEIIEYIILNPKNGKPLGEGFWKCKNKYLLLTEKLRVPKDNEYIITIEQMMRKKKLYGIENISLEIYSVLE